MVNDDSHDSRHLEIHDFDIKVLGYKRRFLAFKKSTIFDKAALEGKIVKGYFFFGKKDLLILKNPLFLGHNFNIVVLEKF